MTNEDKINIVNSATIIPIENGEDGKARIILQQRYAVDLFKSTPEGVEQYLSHMSHIRKGEAMPPFLREIEGLQVMKFAGEYAAFGGRLEKGETIEQAARREFMEETGLEKKIDIYNFSSAIKDTPVRGGKPARRYNIGYNVLFNDENNGLVDAGSIDSMAKGKEEALFSAYENGILDIRRITVTEGGKERKVTGYFVKGKQIESPEIAGAVSMSLQDAVSVMEGEGFVDKYPSHQAVHLTSLGLDRERATATLAQIKKLDEIEKASGSYEKFKAGVVAAGKNKSY